MKKLTKLEKFGMAASVIVIATYFYMSKIYDPESKSLKATAIKLNKVIKKVNQIGDPPDPKPLEIKEKHMGKKLKKLTDELLELGGRSEEDSELTRVMAEITHLSDAANLKIKSMSQPKKVSANDFNWAAYEVMFSGTYGSYLDFLRDLKELAYPVQVKNILIQKDESINIPGLLTIKFQLMI